MQSGHPGYRGTILTSHFYHCWNNEGFNEIIQKSIQYLIVKKNSEPLRINLPKRFNINDEICSNKQGIDIMKKLIKNKNKNNIDLNELSNKKIVKIAQRITNCDTESCVVSNKNFNELASPNIKQFLLF